MASLKIRFSSHSEATTMAIAKWYQERHNISPVVKARKNGDIYAIDIYCEYFSRWHVRDIAEAIGTDDFFFGVEAIKRR